MGDGDPTEEQTQQQLDDLRADLERWGFSGLVPVIEGLFAVATFLTCCDYCGCAVFVPVVSSIEETNTGHLPVNKHVRACTGISPHQRLSKARQAAGEPLEPEPKED